MRGRATIAKTKEGVRGVRIIIKTKGPPRTADSDAHLGFDDDFDLYMLAGIQKNAEEVWNQPVVQDWMNSLCFVSYHLKTWHLEKYDHVAPFLDVAMVLCDQRAHAIVAKKDLHYLRNIE